MNKSDLLYKEQENKRKGFVISLIIHILLFLLFFIRVMTIPDIPDQGGILIAFGEPDTGVDTEMPVNDISAPSSSQSSTTSNSEPEVVSKEKDDLAPVKAKDNEKTKKPKSHNFEILIDQHE